MHWKPDGTFFEQALRIKLRETGTFKLMPKILALMAVQRQTAASRSANPWMRLQHGLVDGVPMVTPINPPSKSAHTPNFRVSLGHVALLGGVGVGGAFGVGVGGVFGVFGGGGGHGVAFLGGGGGGFGLGGVGQSHALERVKITRFITKKKAIDVVFLQAILL